MNKLLLDLSTHLETARLNLRPYQPGDGSWYFQVGQKNCQHLLRYESNNPILGIHNAEEGEILVRELALEWAARRSFFWAALEKTTRASFVAQVYVGPVNWETPEFEIGYFADLDHQGYGYVTEAVQAVLGWIFTDLHAHRVSIHCSDSNIRSQRIAERCGFRLEGHTREDHPAPDGSRDSSLHYGLLKNEFSPTTVSTVV